MKGELPELLKPEPSADYTMRHIDTGEGDYYPNDEFDIRCFRCQYAFGRVKFHHAVGGGPVIGALVMLDPLMVERPALYESQIGRLARFGVPDDVRRGGRPRRPVRQDFLRKGPYRPFWAHCPKCNRGQRVSPWLDRSSLL
jgi:hypothetical protein